MRNCTARSPPRDIAEFLDAARRLRTRTIYEAIRNAEADGHATAVRLCRKLLAALRAVVDFPQGLIPIGDSICRFNPVYAQGMSVAAREACILADLLARRARGAGDLAGLPQDFLAEVQPWLAGAWSMSTTPDLAYPQTRGGRPVDLEHTLGFVAALYRIAACDPAVHELLVEVHHLARPETTCANRASSTA